MTLYDGTAIQLTAVPDAKYELTAWHNTDADASKALVNTATIRGKDLTVTVEFQVKVVRTLTVPGDYDTIQKAVDAAREGDTVVVDPGIYRGADRFNSSFTLVVNKPVVITSRNPDDPCTVAATIIDGYATMNNFHNMGVLISPGAGRQCRIGWHYHPELRRPGPTSPWMGVGLRLGIIQTGMTAAPIVGAGIIVYGEGSAPSSRTASFATTPSSAARRQRRGCTSHP